MALTSDFESWRGRRRPERAEALALAQGPDAPDLSVPNLSDLQEAAVNLRDQGYGKLISYSRKVFIPLT